MQLRRVLGTVDAAWLVAGSMVGAGIFYTPGLVAAYLPGLLGPLFAWTLGGLLALCGAAVYGELGSRLPHAGGDYRYLARAFGPRWGFLSGWGAMLLTFSAAAAVMCIVTVDYLAAALGIATDGALRRVAPPALALLLTLANVAGARVAGRTTVVLTAIPLLGIVGLFGGGILFGRAEMHWPEAATPSSSWPIALGAAMMPVFFTYSGWNVAAYVASEIRDPERSLPRALVGGTLAVMLLYLAVNLVLLLVVPPTELAGSTIAGSLAARRLLGPAAERVLGWIIALAVAGTATVTLMAGARIYYAMAEDGLAPRWLRRVNEAGVPSGAVWAGGIWTAMLSLSGRVEALVNGSTLAILLLSSMAAAALFVLRGKRVGQPEYLCPGYPLTPAIYVLACLSVALASAVMEPRQSLYGVLIVAAGLPAYEVARRFWALPA
jgi:APA family basic amino acid/polyamine antiporter